MTTKQAIELIKKDIEHYKKLVGFMGDLTNSFFKNHNFDDASPDSMMYMIKETRQSIHKMLIALYTNQIKYYENILVELESKTKQESKIAN